MNQQEICFQNYVSINYLLKMTSKRQIAVHLYLLTLVCIENMCFKKKSKLASDWDDMSEANLPEGSQKPCGSQIQRRLKEAPQPGVTVTLLKPLQDSYPSIIYMCESN